MSPCSSTAISDEVYRSRLSNAAKARKVTPIWSLLPVEDSPGMLSLLAGKPNPATFPFEYLHLGVRTPGSTPENMQVNNMVVEGAELARALQYGTTPGFPELRAWITGLVSKEHNRSPEEGWRVSLGPGSQDLLYKALSALVNPGDTVIMEGPTYPGMTPISDALLCEYVVIDVDENGIAASELEKALANWDHNGPKPFPKVLYTIPFGGNPSGVSASLERRIQVLEICRKYDILILEDDPYYFLYYGEAPKPPSYFSLEKELGGETGRVLRFESFSKILAAGFRLGWLVGAHTLLDAIEIHNSMSVVQASSLTQVVVLKLLTEWGIDGFLTHAKATADFYLRRRDAFITYLNKHLTGLADWTVPKASMFFWLKLRLPPTVDCHNVTTESDSTAFIRDKMRQRGVLALPGSTAYVDDRRTARVRVSFSLLSDEDMDEALRRMAEVLREELQSKSPALN